MDCTSPKPTARCGGKDIFLFFLLSSMLVLPRRGGDGSRGVVIVVIVVGPRALFVSLARIAGGEGGRAMVGYGEVGESDRNREEGLPREGI
jgi:hypothetical protein